MSLTKNDILDAEDLPRQEVPVPEWKGHVWVRTMMAVERDAFEAAVMNGDGINRDNFRARLAVATVVDDVGERLFEDSDIAVLGYKSAAALDRITGVAMKLNGLSSNDIEDLVGNSEPGQSDDSSSG